MNIMKNGKYQLHEEKEWCLEEMNRRHHKKGKGLR